MNETTVPKIPDEVFKYQQLLRDLIGIATGVNPVAFGREQRGDRTATAYAQVRASGKLREEGKKS